MEVGDFEFPSYGYGPIVVVAFVNARLFTGTFIDDSVDDSVPDFVAPVKLLDTGDVDVGGGTYSATACAPTPNL